MIIIKTTTIMTASINELEIYNSVIIKPHSQYTHSAWKNKTFRYEGTVRNIK